MKNITKIKKVLIANRGEIARRIQRTCKKRGVISVNAVSEVDEKTTFAKSADESVVIGSAAPQNSYLNAQAIIEAAKKANCDAAHPGYGFLAENAKFAALVEDAGLVFIGPTSKAIEIMGSKTEARKSVSSRAVPCTPGSEGGLSDKELLSVASEIGFPVIIKAVAGGGGRGMRIVNSAYELSELLPRARAEAEKNFDNSDVYLEKFIVEPRHVEVQIAADKHGNVIHLGTRDCSTQRRHQKLVEEAPAPFLEPFVREGLHKAAIDAAKSVGYHNLGTVEFLVEGNNFYFLEMNTRVQVEHPITEEITGIDLVDMQFDIAEGKKLSVRQEDVKFNGHAIEYRINAEDPTQGFQPVTGTVNSIIRPENLNFREDSGIEAQEKVTPFYDGMISKLIVHASSRNAAIMQSRKLLRRFKLEGIETTLGFHRWLVESSPFVRGPLDIAYIEREFNDEAIQELKAGGIIDSQHQRPVGGAEVKNLFNYTSKKFDTTYTIEVLHQRDGCFVATPIDAEGRRGNVASRRMSNGFDTVVTSLVKDVLEVSPPAEIFGK